MPTSTFCETYSSPESTMANLCSFLVEDSKCCAFSLEAYNPDTLLATAEPQITGDFSEFLDFIADTTEQGHSYYVITACSWDGERTAVYTCDMRDCVITCTY